MNINAKQTDTVLGWLATLDGEGLSDYEDCKLGFELMKSFPELGYENDWLERHCKETIRKQEEEWHTLASRFDMNKMKFACNHCSSYLSENEEEKHRRPSLRKTKTGAVCECHKLRLIEDCLWATELRDFLVSKNKMNVSTI